MPVNAHSELDSKMTSEMFLKGIALHLQYGDSGVLGGLKRDKAVDLAD